MLPDWVRYGRNTLLRPVEARLARRHASEDFPVVFVVGVPRSGSTLLFQLMARHLAIAYPTNAMAGYWMAPIWAARRQPSEPGEISLNSSLGGTSGPSAPHEFGWFWNHWADFSESDQLSPKALSAIDGEGLRREFLGLAGSHGRPFLFKSITYCSHQIPWLQDLLPNARFLWVRRRAPFVAQSLLAARVERYGDPGQWWSTRPAQYRAWQDRPPEVQVALQIQDIERAVSQGFDGLDPARHLTTHYEDMVADPARSLGVISAFLAVSSTAVDTLGPLQDRNQRRVPESDFDAILAALDRVRA
jgi:hypothetical protein